MKFEILKNDELGEVRSFEENGMLYFVAKDVAEKLGYANPQQAIRTHCKRVRNLEELVGAKIQHPSKNQLNELFNGLNINSIKQTNIIPESDVFRLITKSNKPEAIKFEEWLMEEVLPTIRKTGGYVLNAKQFMENYLPYIDKTQRDFLINSIENFKKQSELIHKQRPFVEAYKLEHEAGMNISVEEYAKILSNEAGVVIGRNRLYKWLKNNEYIMDNNAPYQKYIDNGYLVLKKIYRDIGDGRKIPANTTLITPKGKIKLKDKIIKSFKGEKQ